MVAATATAMERDVVMAMAVLVVVKSSVSVLMNLARCPYPHACGTC